MAPVKNLFHVALKNFRTGKTGFLRSKGRFLCFTDNFEYAHLYKSKGAAKRSAESFIEKIDIGWKYEILSDKETGEHGRKLQEKPMFDLDEFEKIVDRKEEEKRKKDHEQFMKTSKVKRQSILNFIVDYLPAFFEWCKDGICDENVCPSDYLRCEYKISGAQMRGTSAIIVRGFVIAVYGHGDNSIIIVARVKEDGSHEFMGSIVLALCTGDYDRALLEIMTGV